MEQGLNHLLMLSLFVIAWRSFYSGWLAVIHLARGCWDFSSCPPLVYALEECDSIFSWVSHFPWQTWPHLESLPLPSGKKYHLFPSSCQSRRLALPSDKKNYDCLVSYGNQVRTPFWSRDRRSHTSQLSLSWIGCPEWLSTFGDCSAS